MKPVVFLVFVVYDNKLFRQNIEQWSFTTTPSFIKCLRNKFLFIYIKNFMTVVSIVFSVGTNGMKVRMNILGLELTRHYLSLYDDKTNRVTIDF